MNSAQFGDVEARRIRLQRAFQAGVRAILAPAAQPVDWYAFDMHKGSFPTATEGPEIFTAAGIHPWLLQGVDDRADDAYLRRLADLLERRPPQLRAVGECGLDYAIDVPPARQRRILDAQIELARAHQLPLVLHGVRAHDDLLAALDRADLRPSVIHGWTGSAELARRYWTRGHFLGFGGAVTRPGTRRVLDAARAIPGPQMLIETDSPWQSPWQTPSLRRPALNEPAFIVDVARALAALRGEPTAQIAAQTRANAHRLLGLAAPPTDDGPTP